MALKVNPFGDDQADTPDPSYAAVTASFFGQVDPSTRNVVAKPIDIFEIAPDPAQPRRAIPSAARAGWDGSAAGVADMLARWVHLVGLDLEHYLDPEWQRPDALPAGAADLVELIDLAISIRDGGLNNPITVVRAGAGYQIDTGERRWLAHQLLYAYYNKDTWRKIAARVHEAPDVWRQAAENAARANLNAIGKARQYALLVMDLHREAGARFEPLGAFEHERQFYAQAVDLKLPYGKGPRLLSAMNLKSRTEVQRCQMLLDLTDRVWTIGDDISAPQSILLKCVGLDDNLSLTLLQQLSHDGTIQTPKAEAKAASDEFKRTLEKASSKVAKASPDELREMLAASERLTQMIKERLK